VPWNGAKKRLEDGPGPGLQGLPRSSQACHVLDTWIPKALHVLRTLNGNFMKTTGLDLKRRLKMSDIIII
jgi:hypothetical protein